MIICHTSFLVKVDSRNIIGMNFRTSPATVGKIVKKKLVVQFVMLSYQKIIFKVNKSVYVA